MNIYTTSLVLVDLQKGFDEVEYWGRERNNPQAEENCKLILQHFRRLKLNIFHVKHNSTNRHSPLHVHKKGNEFIKGLEPYDNEQVISKNVNSAFIGTDLQQRLQSQNIRTIIFIGLTTDHCVSTSVRMSANFGFETFVISDATATFNKIGIGKQNFEADLIHRTALASLQNEFAEVLTTEELLQRFFS